MDIKFFISSYSTLLNLYIVRQLFLSEFNLVIVILLSHYKNLYTLETPSKTA